MGDLARHERDIAKLATREAVQDLRDSIDTLTAEMRALTAQMEAVRGRSSLMGTLTVIGALVIGLLVEYARARITGGP